MSAGGAAAFPASVRGGAGRGPHGQPGLTRWGTGAARRAAAAAAVLSVAAVAAAGCGGGNPPAARHRTPGTGARAGASAAPIPTGTQLGQILRRAHPPAGWGQVSTVSHDEIDSGPMLQPADGPGPSQYNCTAVDSGAQAQSFIDWWSKSNATITYQYPSEPGPPEVNLTLGAYEPGYAAKTITMMSGLARRCRSFRDRYMDNYPDTTRTTAVPGLGNQNLYLLSVGDTPNGAITDQVLLVRVGNDMAGVDTDDAGGGSVRAATVQGFAAWLIQVLDSRPRTR